MALFSVSLRQAVSSNSLTSSRAPGLPNPSRNPSHLWEPPLAAGGSTAPSCTDTRVPQRSGLRRVPRLAPTLPLCASTPYTSRRSERYRGPRTLGNDFPNAFNCSSRCHREQHIRHLQRQLFLQQHPLLLFLSFFSICGF